MKIVAGRGPMLMTVLASIFAVVMMPGVASSAEERQAEPVRKTADLANRCVRVSLGSSSRFFLKPTGPGTYMFYEGPAKMLSVDGRKVRRSGTPGPDAEWAIRSAGRSVFTISPRTAKGALTVSRNGGLKLGRGTDFLFFRTGGCKRFPEASVGATGPDFRGTRRDGSVRGFVDSHLHITANARAGGRIINGENFHRFGIEKALGDDSRNHGVDGSDDFTGNLLRTGLPFGGHDTAGWPGFTGWPSAGTNTHQQVYYQWLKRSFKAGLRLVVAQTVEDEPICEIVPVKSHDCDETRTVKLEIRQLRKLQQYVDAQAGGPGRGWFRLVGSPARARKVIAKGKLAVVIGVESSNPFGCSERYDKPQCTRASIDRGIKDMRRSGVRTMFLAHWVDNALAGPAPEGGSKGAFINVFNKFQTGNWLKVEDCPNPAEGEVLESLGPIEIQVLSSFYPKTAYLKDEQLPEYPDKPQCNVKGLTALGAYAVRRMMDNHMLIELDHLSERTRESVMKIAEARNYPLVSGHTGTGGPWSASKLKRLYRLGGFASATPDEAPGLARKINSFAKYRSAGHYFGVGLGTDTGGFSTLPGPPEPGDELKYPFRSWDGKVKFERERSGTRTFDLNTDGVAHYGLFADLLALVQREPGGKRAMSSLFRSAESYLRTWELAYRR